MRSSTTACIRAKAFLCALACSLLAQRALGFAVVGSTQQTTRQRRQIIPRNNNVALSMGLFDGISKAFANQDFQSQDQRVRASHILIKDDSSDDVDATLEKVMSLMGELRAKIQQDPDKLISIFADLARRESQCPSAAQGGDLGLFGPGKMVPEFDVAVFPPDNTPSPPPGSILGPIVTDFGTHIILVTQREQNRDQVEEKLARIDPDAAM